MGGPAGGSDTKKNFYPCMMNGVFSSVLYLSLRVRVIHICPTRGQHIMDKMHPFSRAPNPKVINIPRLIVLLDIAPPYTSKVSLYKQTSM